MNKSPYQIIERPLLSEKCMDMANNAGKYTFKVAKDANKIEIRQAIEAIYPKVQVSSVNTMIVKGKKRRLNRRFPEGRTSDWKKAIVTLQPGQTLTMFEGL